MGTAFPPIRLHGGVGLEAQPGAGGVVERVEHDGALQEGKGRLHRVCEGHAALALQAAKRAARRG